MKVIVPPVYGFCNGVRSAIETAMAAAERAERLGLPCYLYGSIVHNRIVSGEFVKRGVRTIYSPDDVPPGIVVIRTHGIPDALRSSFAEKGFEIVDATCPVVLRNMALLRSAGSPAVIIGRKGHSEITALSGARPDALIIERPSDLRSLCADECWAAVQTTLSLSLLSSIREEAASLGIRIRELNSICGASESRRKALLSVLPSAVAAVVVGDEESANSRELRDLAAASGKPAYLALFPSDLPDEVFSFPSVVLTAGASAPDDIFAAMKAALERGSRF